MAKITTADKFLANFAYGVQDIASDITDAAFDAWVTAGKPKDLGSMVPTAVIESEEGATIVRAYQWSGKGRSSAQAIRDIAGVVGGTVYRFKGTERVLIADPVAKTADSTTHRATVTWQDDNGDHEVNITTGDLAAVRKGLRGRPSDRDAIKAAGAPADATVTWIGTVSRASLEAAFKAAVAAAQAGNVELPVEVTEVFATL